MRFVIDKIEYQETLTIVVGKTGVGTIKGIWTDPETPVIGKTYDIELIITSPNEINISERKLCLSVYLDNENVIFIGRCYDSDDKAYYVLFDIGWMETLDIDIITSRKKKGDYISFSANFHNIKIYPNYL